MEEGTDDATFTIARKVSLAVLDHHSRGDLRLDPSWKRKDKGEDGGLEKRSVGEKGEMGKKEIDSCGLASGIRR